MQNSLSPEDTGKERSRLHVGEVRDFAIFLLDRAGYVVSWNHGAEDIKGYQAEEILGEHYSRFFSAEDIQTDRPARLLAIAAEKDSAREECWRIRKDGTRIWASVVVSALRDGQGRLHGFCVLTQDLNGHRRADEAMPQASRHLLELLEDERRRVAQELHDGTAANLAALSVNIDLLRECSKLGRDPEISQALSTCQELADRAFKEIRLKAYLMYCPSLDGVTLPEALRWYTEGFTRHTKIKTDLDVSPAMAEVPRDFATGLFRIVQEWLANLQRHSGSQTAEIRLRKDADSIVLSVRDYGDWQTPRNGGQASKGSVDAKASFKAIGERVHLLGGQVEIQAASPGTQVRVTFPLSSGAAASASSGSS